MHKQREYIATLTTKGQVTVPVEIRRALDLKAQDKLIFRLANGKIEVEPLPMTLEEAYGSVSPLGNPESFDVVRAMVREERAAKRIERDQ
jgi:AbrB family looped-hinge helix DNA binding protein